MGRSSIDQGNPGQIKSIQRVTTGTTASSGTTTVNFSISSVNRDKTVIVKTGWSEHEPARSLTSSTNLQISFRRGDLNHYWRSGYIIVEYYE